LSPSLRSRTAAMHKSNSRSPSPRVVSKSQKVEDLDSSSSKIKDLERQLSVKGETVQKLENIITQLESRFPSVQEVVRNRLEQERMSFEEKSEKVGHLSTVSSVSTIYPRSNQNSSLTYFSNNH
jgi:septal ring factor EnvC (AmiA/AmiB activator)